MPVNPENIILRERNQSRKATYCIILHEVPRIGKSIKKEGRLVVPKGWEDWAEVGTDC